MKDKKLLLVMLSAFLIGLSRLPLHTGFVAFAGLIPLLYYFDSHKTKITNTIIAAFLFSIVYCFTGLHWISLVTVAGFLGIIPLFTIYFSITFYLIIRLWKRFPKLKLISLVSVWLSLELLQNYSELRFPWNDIGYAIADYLPLIQIADVGGIYLISAIILMINYLLYRFIAERKSEQIILIVAVFFLWFGYGLIRIGSIKLKQEPLSIAIVQPSIHQDRKWDFKYLKDNFQKYKDITYSVADSLTSMVIWPESCVPVPIIRNVYYKSMVTTIAMNTNMAIFAGFPDRVTSSKEGEQHYNAASLIHPDGNVDKPYYKNYLVPFGERMILLDFIPSLRKLDFGQANWEYGKEINSFHFMGFTFVPQICFEVAFPEHMYRAYKKNPDFIVNITNDAWFGHSAGTYQHAMLTRFRAVEARKQIYRAANTGISLVVDPIGRIVAKTDLFDVTGIVKQLKTTEAISYYYTRFYKFIYILPIFSLILFAVSLVKSEKEEKEGIL